MKTLKHKWEILWAILIIASVLSMISCKSICRFCQKPSSTIIKDSVSYVPFYIQNKADSMILRQLIECKNGIPNMKKDSVVKNNQFLIAEVAQGNLIVKYKQNPDSVKVFVPVFSHIESKVVVNYTNFLTGAQKFFIKGFWILLAICIVYLGFRIIKNKNELINILKRKL